MIEIEIIPDDNFGKFINIDEKNDKYCHVFFNDDDKEKKLNKYHLEIKLKKLE